MRWKEDESAGEVFRKSETKGHLWGNAKKSLERDCANGWQNCEWHE